MIMKHHNTSQKNLNHYDNISTTYTTPAKNARISLKYAQEFFIKMYVVLLNQKHHQKNLSNIIQRKKLQ